MKHVIKCEINICDYPGNTPRGVFFRPEFWEPWIIGKLKEAGIPINNALEFRSMRSDGCLHRQDDPTDFGKCVYTWVSE